MKKQTLFKIGVLCKKTGKTRRTVYYYETLGLLEPSAYTRGGCRLYGEDTLEKIYLIEKFQRAGMSLSDIRLLNDVKKKKETGALVSRNLRDILDEKVRNIQEKINVLQDVKNELSAASLFLTGCQPCSTPMDEVDCTRCEIHGEEDSRSPIVEAFL